MAPRLVPLVLILLALVAVEAQLPPYPPTCYGAKRALPIGPHGSGVVWKGWGTTLGWWASWAGTLPPAAQRQVADLVFGNRTGLGLNIANYIIGGGGGSKSLQASVKDNYNYTPGFKRHARGKYNWAADAAQRNILVAAKARGVTHIQAVSYSPPAFLTLSKNFGGSRVKNEPNIMTRNLPAFANYLADVAEQYHKIGLTFEYLSPQNEALEGWWVAPGSQEGCNMNIGLISRLLPLVHKALLERNVPTKLAGFDSFITYTLWNLKENLTPEARDLIHQINIHSYRGIAGTSFAIDNATRTQMRYVASTTGKPVATSEWEPFISGSEDEKGLFMGSQISMDVNVIGVRAFSIFQAVGPGTSGGSPAFIYSPFSPGIQNPVFTIGAMFYYMKQFSAWIVPGSKMIVVPTSCHVGLVAAYDPNNRNLVLVITNMTKKTRDLSFRLKGFKSTSGGGTASLVVYRTCGPLNERYTTVKAMGGAVSLPGVLKVVAVPKSITTFVITRVIR